MNVHYFLESMIHRLFHTQGLVFEELVFGIKDCNWLNSYKISRSIRSWFPMIQSMSRVFLTRSICAVRPSKSPLAGTKKST